MSTPSESRVSPSWNDRFQRPSSEALLAALPTDARGVASRARESIGEIAGTKECLDWTGPAWRWCWCFTLTERHAGRAWVVPDPAAVLIVVELDEALLEKANTKKSPRHIREAIASSTPVGPNRWCQWTPTSPGEVDEIVAAIRACMSHS